MCRRLAVLSRPLQVGYGKSSNCDIMRWNRCRVADDDVGTASPRHGDYRCAVSNSFGFGGENAALVFGAY